MPKKIKTIKLTDGIAAAVTEARARVTTEEEWRKLLRFRVEQITDSIEYHTGQLLERREVELLCHSNDWKVTIAGRKQ